MSDRGEDAGAAAEKAGEGVITPQLAPAPAAAADSAAAGRQRRASLVDLAAAAMNVGPRPGGSGLTAAAVGGGSPVGEDATGSW